MTTKLSQKAVRELIDNYIAADAEIKKIDVKAAKAMPGVIDVLVGKQIKADGIGTPGLDRNHVDRQGHPGALAGEQQLAAGFGGMEEQAGILATGFTESLELRLDRDLAGVGGGHD